MFSTNYRKIQSKLTLAIALGILSVLIVGITIARAADSVSFSLQPANNESFNFKIQPGASINSVVIVSNTGNIPVKLRLYSIDAYTNQNSGNSFKGDNEPQQMVGVWIKLEQQVCDLPAGGKITIKFALNVPTGTAEKQYIGGLVAQEVDSGTPKPGVNIKSRMISQLKVEVGTPPPSSLKINGAKIQESSGHYSLALTLQSDGGLLIQPKGEVSLADSSGKSILNKTLTLNSILPGFTIDYPVQGELPTTPATYRVKASLDYGGSAPAVYEGNVTLTAVTAIATTQIAATVPTQAAALIPGVTSSNPVSASIAQPQKQTEDLPLVAILLGSTGFLLIVVVGMGSFILGSRKRKS